MKIKLDKNMLKDLLLLVDLKVEYISDEFDNGILTVTMPYEYLSVDQIKAIKGILFLDEYYVNVDEEGNYKVLIDFPKIISFSPKDPLVQKAIDILTNFKKK